MPAKSVTPPKVVRTPKPEKEPAKKLVGRPPVHPSRHEAYSARLMAARIAYQAPGGGAERKYLKTARLFTTEAKGKAGTRYETHLLPGDQPVWVTAAFTGNKVAVKVLTVTFDRAVVRRKHRELYPGVHEPDRPNA